MKIEIEGATIAEIKGKLVALVEALGIFVAQPQVAPVEMKVETQVEANLEEVTSVVKPKRSSKKKVEEPSDKKTEQTTAPTRQDAVDALIKVNALLGVEAAKSVLEKFGCSKMRDLKEENFLEFVSECAGILSRAEA